MNFPKTKVFFPAYLASWFYSRQMGRHKIMIVPFLIIWDQGPGLWEGVGGWDFMAFLTFGTSCTCECGPWHMWKTPVTQVSPRGHMWLKQQIYQLYDVKYWDTSLLQSMNHGNHWTSPAEDKECGQFQFHQKFSWSHFLPYLGLHICNTAQLLKLRNIDDTHVYMLVYLFTTGSLPIN